MDTAAGLQCIAALAVRVSHFSSYKVLSQLGSQCRESSRIIQAVHIGNSRRLFWLSSLKDEIIAPRGTWITAGNSLFGVICEA